MFIVKLMVSAVLRVALIGLMLFLPAGTAAWDRAWAFLALLLGSLMVNIIALLPGHKELLQERLLTPPIQKKQPAADKIALTIFFMSFFGLLVFTSLDVFRLHLLRKPGALVSSLGLFFVIGGLGAIFLAFKENAFAAPVVKLQDERGQRVVDSGVYGVVRHPIYAGAVLLFMGLPLWLESYAGLLAATVPAGALAIRAVLEERFLLRELAGYGAYLRKVRYRLVPWVW